LQPNDRFLDYGSGDGYFLRIIKDLKLEIATAFEPSSEMMEELQSTCQELKGQLKTKCTSDPEIIEKNYYNKAAIMEVLEHLTERNAFSVLCKINEAMTDDGILVISVPIEIGPVGLFKNLFRLTKGEPHDNTSARNVIKAFFARPVDHGEADYINSHVGFNFKKLIKIIKSAGFKIQSETFSPFGFGNLLLNSQVFFVCIKTH
jgi:2-polyprenyl-3-methyl-5-hydroxy-6-metoxy-1,4-benzoquinol methylase